MNPDSFRPSENTPPPLVDFLAVREPDLTEKQAATLVKGSRWLTHEMVPSHLKGREVWKALLERKEAPLPMTALIRNLPTLTCLELLPPLSPAADKVVSRITDPDVLIKTRVHPVRMLTASLVYGEGRSRKGDRNWTPNPQVHQALGRGFHAAFGSLPKVDKSLYVGIDISGSMNMRELMGVPRFTPAMAASALAICLSRMSDRSVIYGFSNSERHDSLKIENARMVNMNIGPDSTVHEAMSVARKMAYGATDCSLPMLDAMERGISADAFIILTDNETWAGKVHPSEALRRYRRRTGIPAKLIVVAMASPGYSIADPYGAGMLDVVGLDDAAPRIVEDFLTQTGWGKGGAPTSMP